MCYNQGFLQLGVLIIRSLSFKGSYNQELLQSGALTIRGSYNQGLLQLGILTTRGSYNRVLTIRDSYNQGFLQSGSYNQGFLQSGVQINVSYLTNLCPDVDNDRKILRSGVCVDGEFSHPVRILCSDVEIDLTRSYSY